jgi:hypothetical protein
MESETVKVIRIDADRMAAIPIQQERVARGDIPRMYDWVRIAIEKEEYPLYVVDRYTAFQLCSRMPHKYKLYQSTTVSGPTSTASGAIAVQKIYPCVSKVSYVPKRDEQGKEIINEENNERETVRVIEWIEDRELRSVPQSAAVTQESAATDSRIAVLEAKVKELEESLKFANNGILQRDGRIKRLQEELAKPKGPKAGE